MVKAICDRCGFTVKHDDCRIEWTQLFVCRQCYDPPLVYLTTPYVNPAEGAPVKNVRLDNTNYTFTDDNDPITGDDL
jgi:hypothetical protein